MHEAPITRLHLTDEQIEQIEAYIPLAKRKEFSERVKADMRYLRMVKQYDSDMRFAQNGSFPLRIVEFVAGMYFVFCGIAYGFATLAHAPYNEGVITPTRLAVAFVTCIAARLINSRIIKRDVREFAHYYMKNHGHPHSYSDMVRKTAAKMAAGANK